LLSHDLGILADEGFEELRNKLIEVQRMLTALVQRVQPPRSCSKRGPDKGKVASSQ